MRVEVFKSTTDDWYPPYQLQDREADLVQVSFIKLRPEKSGQQLWRVCVWGADDMGLERDYGSEASAWTAFLQVIGWPDVKQDRLIKELGFYSA